MIMELTLIESACYELQAMIQGQVITPEDPHYDEARLAWNRSVVQFPAVIVAAKTAEDVMTAVIFAREHNMDPIAQTARVEAGVQWGAVLAAAQAHGLAPLLGSSPTVGAVGYTLLKQLQLRSLASVTDARDFQLM